MLKLHTTRAITFPGETPRVYIDRISGGFDFTANDERVLVNVGVESTQNAIKNYISGHEHCGKGEAHACLAHLQELIVIAQAAHEKILNVYSIHSPQAVS